MRHQPATNVVPVGRIIGGVLLRVAGVASRFRVRARAFRVRPSRSGPDRFDRSALTHTPHPPAHGLSLVGAQVRRQRVVGNLQLAAGLPLVVPAPLEHQPRVPAGPRPPRPSSGLRARARARLRTRPSDPAAEVDGVAGEPEIFLDPPEPPYDPEPHPGPDSGIAF